MGTIHHELIQVLKQKTPPSENPVDLLTQILPMSKEAAYRRLRGDIPFSLEEALRICNRLNISLDQLIKIKNDHAFIFRINSIFSPDSMEEFYSMMMKIIHAIERIEADSNSYMYLAEYTLPYLFAPKYPLLSRLKIFKWAFLPHMYSGQNKLSEMHIPEKYLQVLKEYSDKAQKIETTMILNKYIFQIFIRDMNYFSEVGILSKDELNEIKKDTLSMLDDLETAAITGQFELGGKAHIYISETFFDSTYIYFQGNGYEHCSMRVFGINHLTCQNATMCNNQKTWIESLIRYSTLISGSGELLRSKYFRAQREIVNSL